MYINEYVKITPQILLDAMQDKQNSITFFDQLIERAEDTQDSKLIQNIRTDELNHLNALSALYEQLTNQQAPVMNGQAAPFITFTEGIKQAILNEWSDSEFYKGLFLDYTNPSRPMFFDIMEDENRHAALLNYIYTKSLEYCCDSVIEPAPEPEPEPVPDPEPEPVPDPEPITCNGITHIVQPGENLFLIGLQYGFSVDAILAENPQLTTPDNISVGQTICIPCPGTSYIIQPGDSLWAISARYGITINDILTSNPQITDPGNIIVGQVICLPVPVPAEYRESLAYMYGGTSAQYLDLLSKTQDSIHTVSPDFFELDANGNLLLAATEKLNTSFIDTVHKQDMLVTPFLSNHWDRQLGITALSNRELLSDQIAAAVDQYQFDGINIDIENVTHEQQDVYVDFIRLLREKLPDDKIISVAVAANPNGWTLGWHGSYDYKRLSDYSDYLIIMVYDESYQGGDEGPVASRGFLERSIQYALQQDVPKDKIVIGIPFFGRYWKQGEEIGGLGLADADVEYLLENYSSTSSYDTEAQSAFASVTIRPGEAEPSIWGGRRLTAGTYHIWYDDPKATRFKLETINANDLYGVSGWTLGQEIPAIWSFYSQALNQM